MKISLHIPPQMWQKIRYSMLYLKPEDEEVISFIFCEKQFTDNIVRYIPKYWVVPDQDCYEYQSSIGLVMKQHFHHYLLEEYLQNQQLNVVHIHTHFGDQLPDFSYVDDRHESDYARFLGENFAHQPDLISGVFDENLEKYQFRLWNNQGTDFEPIEFCNSWLSIDENNISESPEISPMFARQKVFGKGFQTQLNQLKIALIGCGGIGAVFAETLARLGVKNWLLIDDDNLELVNLNRTPGASEEMVNQQWSKVDYVKYLLTKIYPDDGNFITAKTTIQAIENIEQIIDYDLIVVATDNHHSRQIAQELALKYQRPFMSLGTHIDIDSDGIPKMYARITIPPLGGGWCLMCGNMINLQQSALETAANSITQLANSAGYLDDVEAPAVFWLNNICASTTVGILHGVIAGFVNVDEGLDWVYHFPSQQWLKTIPEHLHNENCLFCTVTPLSENDFWEQHSDDFCSTAQESYYDTNYFDE
ncbi:ThiF family adenylyltransferase [Cyanobacterium stanieri LEGE 03274]|uniref:ThiF family adenylyltransferase n=1 Tax=Cyanobacterium stanieri LEGE 03274 TaxID=1828756 RepID=A0ABR9V138_9CHRO|nr:ThiF family adenylyltransferase [Cyanobacterium stanieri]MBE9221597.1 ThiF family adenylyltransferase [Cyanobacterium stanieri LEGE 03274]